MLTAMNAVALAEINETLAKDDKVDGKCLVDLLAKDHFEEEVYKKTVYEHANHFSESEKIEKLKRVERNFTEFIVNRTADCLDRKKFLKMILEEEDSMKELSVNANYCAKKYVIYKNLLDVNDYKIDVNQEKVDLKNLNCNNEIAKLRQDLDYMFTEDMDSAQKECFAGKTKDLPVFDNLVWIKVLKDINAVEMLKEKEQKRFDDFFPNFFKIHTLCQI